MSGSPQFLQWVYAGTLRRRMRRRRSYSRRRLSSRRRRRAFCRSAARIRAKRPPETVCPVSSHPFSASSSAISSTSDPFTPSVLEHLRALPSVPGPALSSSSAQSSPQGASAADPLFLSYPDTSALLLSVASAPSAAVRMSSLSIFSIIRRLQAIRIINPEARNQKKASAAPAADASLKERGHAILIEGIAASATCSSYRNVLRNGS